jgi:hypothetical protein
MISLEVGVLKRAVAGVALVLSVGLAAAACTSTLRNEPVKTSRSGPRSSPAATAVATPQPSLQRGADTGHGTVIEVQTHAYPFESLMAFGHGALWILDLHVIQRIDASSNRVTGSVRVPGAWWFATGVGKLWAAAGDRLVEIDPATVRVLARVHLPHPVWSVAVAGGSVWVSYRIGGKNATTGGIWQIDPQDLSIVRTLPLADNSINLIGAGGAIWWYGSNLPTLVRFDPATGERTRTRAYVFRGSVTPGDGSLWITDQGTGRVTRADLSTGRILHTWTMRQAESPATGPPFWCVPAPGAVGCYSWGSTYGPNYAWQIDPRSDAVHAIKPPRYLPNAFGLGSYWSLQRRFILRTS